MTSRATIEALAATIRAGIPSWRAELDPRVAEARKATLELRDIALALLDRLDPDRTARINVPDLGRRG